MAKDYSGTRKPISSSMWGKAAEVLGFKEGLSPAQIKTKMATLAQKTTMQAMKRAGWAGAAITQGANLLVGMNSKQNQNKVADKDRGSPSKLSKVVSKKMMTAQMNLAARQAAKIKKEEDKKKNKKPMKRPSSIGAPMKRPSSIK
jgi:hypothetical protein